MKDEDKTRTQLIEELHALRKKCEATGKTSAGETTEKELFHTIVESANDAIISMNTGGTIVSANRMAEKLYGYAIGEMLGKSISDLTPKDSRAIEEQTVARHHRNLASGHLTSLKEGVALRKNGDTFPVDASFYGYQFNGEYFITGIIRDISERKEIEKALEEARDFSDNIIESSIDPIVITDSKGNITRINNAFLKLLGFEKQDQIIGQHMVTFSPAHEGEYEITTGERIQIGPDFFQTMQSFMSRLSQGEKISMMESYHLRADNRVVPVEDTISPLFDKKGEKIGAVGVIRDATDRKKAEKELSDSRDFLARLFETSMEGLVVSDARGYITMVNNKAAEMLDYAREDLIGRHFADLGLTCPEDKETAKQVIEEFLSQGKLTEVERTWKKRDGNIIDVEMNLHQIQDKAGTIIGAMSSFRDIGLRKQADMALRVSEERYRRIFENAFVAILEEDISPIMSVFNDLKPAGVRDVRTYLKEHPEFLRRVLSMITIIDANEAAIRLFGARDKEELASATDMMWREESLAASSEALIAFAEGKPFFQTESIHHTLQGVQKNVILQINFLIKQRDLNRVLVCLVDITPLKAAEKELFSYQQQLRALANQLSIKEEDEKRKIGMYLHDRIGQSLSILKMKMEMMGAELADGYAGGKSAEILGLLEKTIHDTRVLSYELSPVILHELGLEVALEWLTEQTQKQRNMVVSFKSDKKAKQLDDNSKIILYRAVSELLNNVVKHAKADTAAVAMKRKNGQLHITVEDNGVGFDPSQIEGIAAVERGFGLFSIKERLHYLGGSIIIKSAPHKGTHITLLAPLK